MGNSSIEWVDERKLGVLDFADDVPVLHDSWDGIQVLTFKLVDEAQNMHIFIVCKCGKDNKLCLRAQNARCHHRTLISV